MRDAGVDPGFSKGGGGGGGANVRVQERRGCRRGEGAGEDVCAKQGSFCQIAIKIKDFVSEITFHGFIAPPP